MSLFLESTKLKYRGIKGCNVSNSPQMVLREMYVEREEAPSSETGAWAFRPPLQPFLGMRFCHIKSRTSNPEGPCRRRSSLRLHGHTSLFICSPRPCLPWAPAYDPEMPIGPTGAVLCSPSCWSLKLSLSSVSPTGLQEG